MRLLVLLPVLTYACGCGGEERDPAPPPPPPPAEEPDLSVTLSYERVFQSSSCKTTLVADCAWETCRKSAMVPAAKWKEIRAKYADCAVVETSPTSVDVDCSGDDRCTWYRAQCNGVDGGTRSGCACQTPYGASKDKCAFVP